MSFVMDQTKLSRSGYDFIDEDRLHGLLDRKADAGQVRNRRQEPVETAVDGR